MITHPKAIGEITQAIVVAALLKRGASVSTPYGDNQRYDLIVDVNGKLLRAQVKTASVSRDRSRIGFKVCSSHAHTKKGGSFDYHGDVELFLTYSSYTNKVYLVPITEVGVRAVSLRLEPPKNNQEIGVRYAKEYTLTRMLRKLGLDI